jgi:hypothetical protein
MKEVALIACGTSIVALPVIEVLYAGNSLT